MINSALITTMLLVILSVLLSGGCIVLPSPGTTSVPKPSSSSPTTTPPTQTKPSAPPGEIQVETVVRNLDTPWAIDFAPDGRWFVTERTGRIRIVKNGQLEAEPWSVPGATEVGEGGLMGLAIDPQFTLNGFVYAAHTYRTADGRLLNRLVRLKEDKTNGKGVLDKMLVEGITGNSIHDGGRVKFGQDGKLYFTMGDAGNSDSAQNLSSLSGKILRLNSDGTVPEDNPFPGSFVYSYGHRNPQGLAWDIAGRLYETEHGPSGVPGGRDEINLIEFGKNYGWPVITDGETRAGMESPIIQSGSDTWAPTGMTFVKGGAWDGSLLFTGLRGQSLYRVVIDKNDPRKIELFQSLFTGKFGRLRDVVQAPDKSIYVLTSNRDGRGLPSAEDDRILRLTVP